MRRVPDQETQVSVDRVVVMLANTRKGVCHEERT
jgi:hypothetical protein